jgi:hypothetical protein
MGGRSREPKTEQAGNYAFLSEISTDRLNAYGQYSSASHQNNNAGSFTQDGIPKHSERLNHRAADEYKQRTGDTPSWDLRSNGGEANHRKSVGFKD